ncbi:MAG: protein disulfide isomerase family protein [Bacteroidales bacterium]
MVKELDDKLFRQLIFDYSQGKNAPVLVKRETVIEFWIPGEEPSESVAAEYTKLSEEFPQVDFTRVSGRKYHELDKMFGIDHYPSFILITPDGRHTKAEGVGSIADLRNQLSGE